MAALPGCTIQDTYAALAPSGAMVGTPGTITALASVTPLFVKQSDGSYIEEANVRVIEPDVAGQWMLVLPSQPNCDPTTVQWTITLPDGTAWQGAVTAAMVTASQTAALTLHDLKATYGWALVNASPSTSLSTYVATTTALGLVTLDQNPASGNPVVLTAPRLGAASGVCDLDSGAHVPLARLSGLGTSQLGSGATLPTGWLDARLGYGARGDGTTDDTAALQAWINAAVSTGQPGWLPPGTYRTTATLTISGPCTLVGSSFLEKWPQFTGITFAGPDMITGCLIQPDNTSAAFDAITITGVGVMVNLSHFAIAWKKKYIGTGHGITCLPPVGTTYRVNGLCYAVWDTVHVWGTDGNHYAFNLINVHGCTFRHIRAYGGGGLYMRCESDINFHYGNHDFYAPSFQCYIGGSSHVIYLDVIGNSWLNLITFVRAEDAIFAPTTQPAGTSAPTSAQKVWAISNPANTRYIVHVGPDLETYLDSVSLPEHGYAETDISPYYTNGDQFGLILFGRNNAPDSVLTAYATNNLNLNSTTTAPINIDFNSEFSANRNYVGTHFVTNQGGNGGQVGAAAGASAGTSPPAPAVAAGSNDIAGQVTFGTGSAPAAGAQATLSFINAYEPWATHPPIVTLTPINAASAALNLYVTSVSRTGFSVSSGNAPAAAQANTTYGFTYHVIG